MAEKIYKTLARFVFAQQVMFLFLCVGVGNLYAGQKVEKKVAMSGYVLATFKSTVPTPDNNGIFIQYQVQKVLKQPVGISLSQQSVLVQQYQPDESNLPLSLKIDINYAHRLFFIEVSANGSKINIVQMWSVPATTSELPLIVANESAGFADVN